MGESNRRRTINAISSFENALYLLDLNPTSLYGLPSWPSTHVSSKDLSRWFYAERTNERRCRRNSRS